MKFLDSIKEILKQEFEDHLPEVPLERTEDRPTEALIPPLLPGWVVAYRDQHNRLHDGTVSRCCWSGSGWTVRLTNGDTIPLQCLRSVGQTNGVGKVVAAWDVRAHGFDGERERGKP